MTNFLDVTFLNKIGIKVRVSLPNTNPANHQIFLPSTLPEVGDVLTVIDINDSFPTFPAYFLGWGAGGGGNGGGDAEIPEGIITEDFLLNARKNKIKQNLIPNIPTNKVYAIGFGDNLEPLRVNTIPNLPASKIITDQTTNDDGELVPVLLPLGVIPDIPAYKIIPEEIENDEGELVPAVLPVEVIPDIPPEKIIGGLGGDGAGIKSIIFEFSEDEISENDDVIFEHNFDTFTPICSIYDNRNEIVYGLIEILDENRIRLDLSNIIFQTGVFRIRVLG